MPDEFPGLFTKLPGCVTAPDEIRYFKSMLVCLSLLPIIVHSSATLKILSVSKKKFIKIRLNKIKSVENMIEFFSELKKSSEKLKLKSDKMK